MTRREFVLLLAVVAAFPSGVEAAALDERRAAQVKENLIHHLVQLTRWPDSARKSDAPVVIALYGDVDDYLVHLLEERSRQPDKPGISVVRVRAATDAESRTRALAALKAAHLVYASPRGDLNLLKSLQGAPVLTVGEGSEFAHSVGIVAFVIEGRKVRVEVNLERARSAQLGFSAQLLQHARIVD